MGLGQPIKQYEKEVLDSIGVSYRGLKWCELGDQIDEEGVVAKELYTALGVDHVSIDLNQDNGAIGLNLDFPAPFLFLNQFDVITNYGTMEHVNNQFQAFKNIHDMCKVGGIMIHVTPLVGNWSGHCRYYYSEEFIRGLAKSCQYEIVNYKILDKLKYEFPQNMIAVCFIKKQDGFTSEKSFNEIPGLTDTEDLTYVGNYTQKKAYQTLPHIKNKIKNLFSGFF